MSTHTIVLEFLSHFLKTLSKHALSLGANVSVFQAIHIDFSKHDRWNGNEEQDTSKQTDSLIFKERPIKIQQNTYKCVHTYCH